MDVGRRCVGVWSDVVAVVVVVVAEREGWVHGASDLAERSEQMRGVRRVRQGQSESERLAVERIGAAGWRKRHRMGDGAVVTVVAVMRWSRRRTAWRSVRDPYRRCVRYLARYDTMDGCGWETSGMV
jgi:hypothetical protein